MTVLNYRRGIALAAAAIVLAGSVTVARGLPEESGAALAPVRPVMDIPDEQAVVTIGTAGSRFTPQAVTVTVGTVVRWTNNDSVVHTTTSDSGHWDWTLLPSDSFTAQFISVGTYPYHCTLHRSMGMVGTINVVRNQGPAPTPPAPGPGDQIAFAYFANELARDQTDVFTIQPDGAARTQRTFSDGLSEAQPNWSPDRRSVVYTAADPRMQSQWSLHVLDTQAGTAQRITNGPEHYEPDWKSDGSLIAFTSIGRIGGIANRSEIAVVRPDGSDYRVLTRLDSASYGVINPVFSPDGTELAFTVSSNYEGGEIYVMNALGQNVRRLFAHPGFDDIEPEWSPDGRYIAFTAGVNRGAATRHDVWVYDILRGVGGTVARHTTWDLRRPSWSPDGRFLVFTARFQLDPPRWALYIVPALGGAVSGPLTTGVEPDWGGSAAVPTETPGPYPTDEVTPPPFPTFMTPEPTSPGPTATDSTPPTFEPPTDVPGATATRQSIDVIHIPVAMNNARG
jgi:plastocyanin/dipeptidyl aminopeptidase/acylaminoacyl peptidase